MTTGIFYNLPEINWFGQIWRLFGKIKLWICHGHLRTGFAAKEIFDDEAFSNRAKLFSRKYKLVYSIWLTCTKDSEKIIGVLCNTSKCYCNTLCILMFQEVQSNDSVVWRLVNRIWKMMDVKKFCDIPFRLSCVMLQIPIKTVIKSSTVFSSLSVLLATFYKTIAAKM